MSTEIIKKHLYGNIHVNNVKFNYEKKNYKGANFIITLPLNS
jgi:hypothetical protein